MNWYLSVLKKYAVFDGRARRQEYWMFCLFNMLVCFALGILMVLLGAVSGALSGLMVVVMVIYALAIILPGLGVCIRRLHDTNRSGWFIFISCIPFVGGLILLYFLVQDSTPGDNAYGPNPKA